jgi:hypothetical protein
MVSRNCVVDLTPSGLDVKIVSSRSTNCSCPMLATERLMSGTVIECGAHFVFRQAISPTLAATGLSLSRCAHCPIQRSDSLTQISAGLDHLIEHPHSLIRE